MPALCNPAACVHHPAMISITEAAASHLKDLIAAKNAPADHGLRISVEKGGCAGMQYVMQIQAPVEGDAVETNHGVSVFVDQGSLDYLRECQLDYEDALNDAGFRIRNPNAARSCGCGTSFEPVAA
jgi:iron-sulfur cluster assembly accessory protein